MQQSNDISAFNSFPGPFFIDISKNKLSLTTWSLNSGNLGVFSSVGKLRKWLHFERKNDR